MPPDLVKLSAMVEPLMVRLSRMTETEKVAEPIFIPSHDESDASGMGWTKNEVALLEAWTYDTVGGGTYLARVLDAVGMVLEWRFLVQGERKQSVVDIYNDALHARMAREASNGGAAHSDVLPTWTVSPIDGWTWLILSGHSVRIFHAQPPQQRTWVVHIYCGHVPDDRRDVLLDNAHRGYVTEEAAKRAALEYLIPRLQRDLVVIDGLLEQLPNDKNGEDEDNVLRR